MDDASAQFSESEQAGVTKIVLELENLEQNGGGYHVHEVPLDTEVPGDNICATTGGHFNPLSMSPICAILCSKIPI